MKRHLEAELDGWILAERKSPIVLRGARQVGKTWLVRTVARRHKKELIEINFERDPKWKQAFVSNDPTAILGEIALRRGRESAPAKSLLFLDEIQAAPEVFAKLRWFAEEMPQFPVVAAGSLLEFVLGEPTFSMPVGRIAYRHIEPMGYVEYLEAHGQERLLRTLADWSPETPLSAVAHERANQWLHRFMMVGGMPAVVARDVAGDSPKVCREAQRELLATYRDDFGKYRGRLSQETLDATFQAAVRSLGRKFVYEHVSPGVKSAPAKQALELLTAAKLCHLVVHSAANGLPLGGEEKKNIRKVILLDIGLFHAWLETPAESIFPRWESLSSDARSQAAEQMLGQSLRLLASATGGGPKLFYWHREGGRAGEVDYVIPMDGRVLPIELKSGSAGAMKSLHQFMFDKGLDVALRVDQNPPSWMDVSVKTTQGDEASYGLLSLPLYMIHEAPKLVSQMKAMPSRKRKMREKRVPK